MDVTYGIPTPVTIRATMNYTLSTALPMSTASTMTITTPSPLPTQALGRECRRDGAKESAHVVEGGDGLDHQRAGLAHGGEPVLRDDGAGHDALVVAEGGSRRGRQR